MVTEFTELLDKDNRFKRFRGTCDQCRAKDLHVKKGRVCFHTKPLEAIWELKNFYGAKTRVGSQQALISLYAESSEQRRDHFQKKLPPGTPLLEKDSYLDWLINSSVNICPHSMSTPNTRYWLELIAMCDGEMGLTLPDGVINTPDIFFQALRIVRGVKTKIKRDEDKRGHKKDSNSN